MKRLIVVLAIILTSSYSFCSSIEDRVVKLEQIVKAQSDSISTYKSKVAEIELQRTFLSDIYNGNAAWLIGTISALFVIILGVMSLLNWNSYRNKTKQLDRDILKLQRKTNIIDGYIEKLKPLKEELFKTKSLLNKSMYILFDTTSKFYNVNKQYKLYFKFKFTGLKYKYKIYKEEGMINYEKIEKDAFMLTKLINDNIENVKPFILELRTAYFDTLILKEEDEKIQKIFSLEYIKL